MYTFVGSLVAIGLSGLWAYIVKQPLVFPSLGATAFLIFETPMAEVGTPRNTIIGHSVGVAAGVLSLAIFGLLDAPSVYVSGVTLGPVGALALAVALTCGILRLVRSGPPSRRGNHDHRRVWTACQAPADPRHPDRRAAVDDRRLVP